VSDDPGTAGFLAIVLHAHLPFVRHPEHERPLEERWLFEAMSECYLPLLGVFERLRRGGVSFALTMSLTAPLAAMLRDPLLRTRFEAHLGRLQKLAERETHRLKDDERFGPVARFYVEQFIEVRSTWERIAGDVVSALVGHADAGEIDLVACAATHAYLPGLLPTRRSLRAQLEIGRRAFEHLTGLRPRGIWLPECAYSVEFDADIARAGFRYAVLDTHGVAFARPRPPFGHFAPIASTAGVAYFARDPASSQEVWSRRVGYPGDAYYRDFYRDVGFDLPAGDLGDEMGPFGTRLMTGLKYHRITGPTDDKAPYQPGVAFERAAVHAEDFLSKRLSQVKQRAAKLPVPPIVVAPYDAELFGHWWFEGPSFLENFFRRLHKARSNGERALEATSLVGYLERHPTMSRATPATSSWGSGGYGGVWIGPESSKLWRHVHHASRYVGWLVDNYRRATGARGRALDQAIVELLLLQSSDWGFIMTNRTVAPYAWARVRAHVHRLRHLGFLVQKASLEAADVSFIDELASCDNFLAGLGGEPLRSAFE
jgi:1,4-alpha-glucan branching enzyme